MSDDRLRWSLIEAAARLRSREVGAVELLEATLDRIAQVEGDVHAFITVTADLARSQAVEAQRLLDRGEGSALTGVPVAVKDLIDVRGVRTTAGSRVLAANVATRDAPVWRRLRTAGAVLVGKSNTHEFAYGGTTEPTRNPWDLDRMVGGSSGGSAAALAAGECFGALGSDTAGSVRIPAAFCGVSALKPTRGAVSTQGVVPLSQTLDAVGPMARTPLDTAALFAAMVGPARARRVQAGADVRGLRVGVVHTSEPVAAPVLAGLEAAAAALADAGAHVAEAGDPRLQTAAALAANFTIMAAESAWIHREWLETSSDLYSRYVRDRLRESMRTPAVDYLEAIAQGRTLRRRWDAALRDHDVLLMTAMPCVAPVAYVDKIDVGAETFERDWLICRDTAFANVTGHPVLAVPAGTDGALPVGVQLLARHNAEHILFPAGQVVYDRLAAPIP